MARKRTRRRKSNIWPWVVGGLILIGIFGQKPDIQSTTTPHPDTVKKQVQNQPSANFTKQIDLHPVTTAVPISKPKPAQGAKTKGQSKLALVEPESKPPSQNISAQPILIRYVDASRLNVRNGPDKKAKTVWTLKRDQRVLVIERKGVWARVKGDRYEGWVHSGFLTPNKSKPKATVASRTPPKKPKARKLSNIAIAKILIKRSFAYYSGNCPCPYSRTARGRRCGRRSAYSRPGGASPLCYRRDVSTTMINDFRSRQ